MNKPLVMIDLDDTLFQTHRRIKPEPHFKVATVDKNQVPLSFMNAKQQALVEWLSHSADLVPVTARSIEALSRVKIEFNHGAICSHGGTILNANNEVDAEWFEIQKSHIESLGQIMNELPDLLQSYSKDLGSIRTWSVEENNLKIYTVAKQNDPESGLFLTELLKMLPAEISEKFYVHTNGNNLAIIPNSISKKNAAEFYLSKMDPNNERVVLGFGDSLSDFEFLSRCDWFGMPKNSQLHKFTDSSIQSNYSERGFYGNV
jgi:hydroxymethylpyrimidine pyrophosphatase-like HAD family hydrolase